MPTYLNRLPDELVQKIYDRAEATVRISRALRGYLPRRRAATTIARAMRRLINQMRLVLNQGLGFFLRPRDIQMLQAFGTYRREPPADGLQYYERGSERWPYIRPYFY